MNLADIMVLADLDDTLFSTRRKIPGDQLASSITATYASNGSHSYMTPRHRQLHDWIDPQRLIPVTARGTDAFANVDSWICKGPYAVLANGATVLDATGRPVKAWSDTVNALLQPHRDQLHQFPQRIKDAAVSMNLDIRVWNVEEPSCDQAYTVVKSNLPDNGDCLRLIENWLVDFLGENSKWYIHRNGNNLALLPPGLSKLSAARFVIEQLSAQGNYLYIGVGDSVSDLEFMRICDFWMTPSGSQLSELAEKLANHRSVP